MSDDLDEWIAGNAKGRDECHRRAHRDLADARAALDRVRALCDEYAAGRSVSYYRLRAALDGPGE